jgi:hypothetical protein
MCNLFSAASDEMEEQMFSKLLLAGVATAGLLLAGLQKASAQVVYACVSSIGNIVIVAGPNAPCPPSAGGPTWTKVTLGGPSPALGSANFFCPNSSTRYLINGSIPGVGFITGTSFGSPIFYDGTNFLVGNAGTYLLHFSADGVGLLDQSLQVPIQVAMSVNGVQVAPPQGRTWTFNPIGGLAQQFGTMAGNILISVAANTVIQLFINRVSIIGNGCSVIFTRLQ